MSQKLAQIIKKLSAGEWAGPNPLILTLFTLVGVVLMVYSCLLFIDGRMQKVPAWPFVLVSLGTGVIGLLPYLALREPNRELSGNKDAWLNLLDSRRTGVILTLSTLGLLTYGAIAGDWRDFIYQWQTSCFVQAMSLAFCLLCLLFPTLLEDDMARRGFNNSIFWTLALIPPFGSPGLSLPASSFARS